MDRLKKILVAVIITVAAAATVIAVWFGLGGSLDRAVPDSEAVSTDHSQAAVQDEAQTAASEAAHTDKANTESDRKDTTVQVTGYKLPLTVKESMDALQIHYGSDYEINSTVEENGINYFAVNLNGERFASVAVDLVTGRAEETIRETGAKTEFSLV